MYLQYFYVEKGYFYLWVAYNTLLRTELYY